MSAGTATVRYLGGAKTAAGMTSELVALRAGATVEGLIAALGATHGKTLTCVLAAASFLLDEVAVHDRLVVVPDGAVLDVLPPSRVADSRAYLPWLAFALMLLVGQGSSRRSLVDLGPPIWSTNCFPLMPLTPKTITCGAH